MEVHCWWCRTPVFGLLQMSMALSGVPLSHNTVSSPFFQVVFLNSSFKNDHRIESKFLPLELEAGVLLLLPWIQNILLANSNGVLKSHNASVLHLFEVELWNSLPFANPAPKWEILSSRLTNYNLQSSFQRHITITPIWAWIGNGKISLIVSMTADFWI